MSLQTIGQKLRAAREAQGLTLGQVYDRTKIPINHLEAIEAGDGEELPEPVYVAGFIKLYADCVGLDGHFLSDEYKRYVEETAGSRKNGRASQSVPVYASAEYVSRSKMSHGAPTIKTAPFNILIMLVMVGVVCWAFNTYTTRAINSVDPSLQSLKESTSRLSPANIPPPQMGQPANRPQAAQPTVQRITLSATKHVWIDVKRLSSGESVYQGNLEAGDRRDFEDAVGFSVRAGDGSSLSVERDGKVEVFGIAGRPVDRVFQIAASSPATPGSTERTAASTASSSGTTAPVKPRKVVKRTPVAAPESTVHRVDDSGYRSIGEGRGRRSIDVPYRYTEGRLDAD